MRHRCLGSFIVFLLFFSILIFMGFAQLKMMLSAKFVANFFEQSQLYNNLDDIGRQLANSTENDQSKTLILSISQNLDQNWIKKQVDTNLAPLFDYLWGKTPKLNIVIDMTPFKSRLPANFSAQIEDMLKTMPTCPEDQTATTTDENTPPCLTPAARTNLQALAQMPNQINLGDYVKNPDSALGQTKLSFMAIKIGFWGSLIFSLLLLGLLVLLGLGWWPSILRWTGLSLILPSGFALLSDVLLKVGQLNLANQYLPTLAPETRTIVAPMITAFESLTFRSGIIFAGVIFLIGLILIILSYALPHPPEPKPVAKPVTPPPPAPPQTKPSPSKPSGLTEAK